jgi:DME family drug/metabolite transporter
VDARERARLRILGAAALFSTGGAAIKGVSLDMWEVAAFRSAFAAAALFAFSPGTRGGWTRNTGIVAIPYACTLVLFAVSNKLTTSANAIFLQSTSPLYVLLLAPLLLGERIRRRDLAFMAALAAGLAAFLIGEERRTAAAADPALGNLLAAASGLTWAMTVIGLRALARSGAPAAAAPALGNLFAVAICAPFVFPLAAPSPADWALLAYLGVFQIGLAYHLLTTGVRHVPAFEGALLLLLEPVLNPLWAWIVHAELPGPWSLAGGLLILAATIGFTVPRQKTPRA